MSKKIIIAMVLSCLLFAPTACGGNTSDNSLSHDATSTDPIMVTPESAIEKANQAKDIENQAREQREQQMQEEMEGYENLP